MDKSSIKTERMMACALKQMLRPLFADNILIGENGIQLLISTADTIHAVVIYEKRLNSVFISVYNINVNDNFPYFEYKSTISVADPDFKDKVRSIICDHLNSIGVSYG